MFSPAVGREEHCKYHWRVWGVLTVSGPHWVCPRSLRVCFPGLHCSARELSEAGPGLHTLPRSTPLRFRLSGTPQRHRLGWACVLCPSQVRAAQATRCLTRGGGCILSPSHLVSWVLNGSAISGVLCVSSGTLISGCDPPDGCQPSRIPGRLG